MGWLGLVMFFLSGIEIVTTGGLRLDGETIDDGLCAILAHGVWVAGVLYYVVLSFITKKLTKGMDHPVPAQMAGGTNS